MHKQWRQNWLSPLPTGRAGDSTLPTTEILNFNTFYLLYTRECMKELSFTNPGLFLNIFFGRGKNMNFTWPLGADGSGPQVRPGQPAAAVACERLLLGLVALGQVLAPCRPRCYQGWVVPPEPINLRWAVLLTTQVAVALLATTV